MSVQEIMVGAAAGQQAGAYLTALKFPQRFNRLIHNNNKNKKCLVDLLKCVRALAHSELARGRALATRHSQTLT